MRADPVCGMEVKIPSEFNTIYNEVKYDFCSESCKTKFLENPNTFINNKESVDIFKQSLQKYESETRTSTVIIAILVIFTILIFNAILTIFYYILFPDYAFRYGWWSFYPLKILTI